MARRIARKLTISLKSNGLVAKTARHSSAKGIRGGAHPPQASKNMLKWAIQKGWWRNENHAIWFLTSLYFLVFTILVFFSHFGKLVLLLPIFFHLLAML